MSLSSSEFILQGRSIVTCLNSFVIGFLCSELCEIIYLAFDIEYSSQSIGFNINLGSYILIFFIIFCKYLTVFGLI